MSTTLVVAVISVVGWRRMRWRHHHVCRRRAGSGGRSHNGDGPSYPAPPPPPPPPGWRCQPGSGSSWMGPVPSSPSLCRPRVISRGGSMAMANDGAARRGGSNDDANHLRRATAAHPPYSCATLECSADELQTAILVSCFLSLGKEYCFGNKKSMRKLAKENLKIWRELGQNCRGREPRTR